MNPKIIAAIEVLLAGAANGAAAWLAIKTLLAAESVTPEQMGEYDAKFQHIAKDPLAQ